MMILILLDNFPFSTSERLLSKQLSKVFDRTKIHGLSYGAENGYTGNMLNRCDR